MSRIPFALALLTGATLLLGCADPTSEKPRAGDGCSTDEDCAIGDECRFGVCLPRSVEQPDLGGEGERDQGTVRDQGSEPPACREREDCRAGEICLAGACAPGNCLSDGDCEGGQVCNALHWCAEDEGCRSDGECRPGQTCIQGECLPPDGCETDAQCVAPEECSEGRCQVLDGCGAGPACGEGERCVDGSCVPLGPTCPQDAACGQRVCGPDPVCGVPCGECAADATCQQGACVPRDPQCPADADCGGRVCGRDPVCGVPCGVCEAGETCEEGACVPSGPQCPAEADCRARACGPDPVCGISCGECDPEQHCEDGLCRDPEPDCPAVADCSGRACGPDPVCGISCGACGANERCQAGACRPVDPGCPASAECGDLACGPDPICGISCGECGPEEECNAGRCESLPRDACRPPEGEMGLSAVDSVLAADLNVYTGSCGGRGPEQVWILRAERAGCHRVSTAGSSFDTVLYVRTSCTDAATELACNDDSGGVQSALEFEAEAGRSYAIFVDGYDALEVGAFHLQVEDCTPVPACPEIADCGDRVCGPDPVCGLSCGECGADEQCSAAGACEALPPDHACDLARPMDHWGDDYRGTTVGAFSTERGSCAGRGPEAVWAFALDAAGCVRLSTAGSAYDTVLHVRRDCGDAASEVACNDDAAGLQSAVEVEAEAEQTYWVFVDGYSENSAGEYSLSIEPCEPPPPTCPDDAQCGDRVCGPDPVCGLSCGACGLRERCDDGGQCVAAADACEAAQWLGAFGAQPGNTTGAFATQQGSCAGRGPEQVWGFALAEPACIRLSTEGSSFDTVLHVRREVCGDVAAEVGCNDDAVGLQSVVELQAEADVAYWVFVDGYAAANQGDYVLTVSPCDAGPCQEGALRLADGASEREGRVEICHEATWGTVCDDLWGAEEAAVVCRQLGFPSAGAEARSRAAFGEGVDPILLDNLACTGAEARLADCPSNGWGQHNCLHSEDAGVVCPQ